jgi:hypothetical protein
MMNLLRRTLFGPPAPHFAPISALIPRNSPGVAPSRTESNQKNWPSTQPEDHQRQKYEKLPNEPISIGQIITVHQSLAPIPYQTSRENEPILTPPSTVACARSFR